MEIQRVVEKQEDELQHAWIRCGVWCRTDAEPKQQVNFTLERSRTLAPHSDCGTFSLPFWHHHRTVRLCCLCCALPCERFPTSTMHIHPALLGSRCPRGGRRKNLRGGSRVQLYPLAALSLVESLPLFMSSGPRIVDIG